MPWHGCLYISFTPFRRGIRMMLTEPCSRPLWSPPCRFVSHVLLKRMIFVIINRNTSSSANLHPRWQLKYNSPLVSRMPTCVSTDQKVHSQQWTNRTPRNLMKRQSSDENVLLPSSRHVLIFYISQYHPPRSPYSPNLILANSKMAKDGKLDSQNNRSRNAMISNKPYQLNQANHKVLDKTPPVNVSARLFYAC